MSKLSTLVDFFRIWNTPTLEINQVNKQLKYTYYPPGTILGMNNYSHSHSKRLCMSKTERNIGIAADVDVHEVDFSNLSNNIKKQHYRIRDCLVVDKEEDLRFCKQQDITQADFVYCIKEDKFTKHRYSISKKVKIPIVINESIVYFI